eukprot:108171-Pyramimonas_sp.AAC.1
MWTTGCANDTVACTMSTSAQTRFTFTKVPTYPKHDSHSQADDAPSPAASSPANAMIEEVTSFPR